MSRVPVDWTGHCPRRRLKLARKRPGGAHFDRKAKLWNSQILHDGPTKTNLPVESVGEGLIATIAQWKLSEIKRGEAKQKTKNVLREQKKADIAKD